MPGIIEQQRQNPISAGPGAPDSDNDAFNTVTGYDPERIEMDEQRDTVSGRINQIVQQNHPLMTQARTRAQQQGARRGLLNSSMTNQAGEMAVLDTALPIAQQDAATSYDARTRNAEYGNRALEFTAQGQQALEQQRANIAGQSRLQREGGEIETGLIGARTDAESRLQQERADIERDLITADADARERLLNRQGQIDQELAQVRGDIERGLMEVEGGIQSQLQQERGEIEEQLQEAEGEIRERLLARQGEIDTELQELRNQGALELTDLENQWRSIIQTNQSAAVYFSETASAIGAILSNPDIPSNQKQGLINHQRTLLEDGLAVIGGIADLDLGALLDFGDAPAGGSGVGGIPDSLRGRRFGGTQWLSGATTPGGTPGQGTGVTPRQQRVTGPVTTGESFDR